jgi:hypothetical protein
MSRGLSEEDATTMVVSGFIEPLVKELPMEYAVEMNRLIQLQMVDSIGEAKMISNNQQNLSVQSNYEYLFKLIQSEMTPTSIGSKPKLQKCWLKMNIQRPKEALKL